MLRPLAGALRTSAGGVASFRWPRPRAQARGMHAAQAPAAGGAASAEVTTLHTELAGLLRVMVARRHLPSLAADAALATLDSQQPLTGSHVTALKKAFKALHRATARDSPSDPVSLLPQPLLAGVSAGLAVLPARALAWRGNIARKAVEALRQAYVAPDAEEGDGDGAAAAPGSQVTFLSACHALLAVSSARNLETHSPDLAAVSAALARALTEVVTKRLPVTEPSARVADAAARLATAAAEARTRVDEDQEAGGEPAALVVFAPPPVAAAVLASLSQQQHAWLLALDAALLQESDRELEAVHAVREALSRAIPGCALAVFGSRAAGVHLPGSDLDLLVQLPRPKTPDGGLPARELAREALYSAKRALSRARLLVADVLLLPRARVPLLRFMTPQRIKCDLSCDGGDPGTAAATGPACAEWALRAATEEPALRPLVLCLKSLVRSAGLSDPSLGGVGGHALMNMALAYLRVAARTSETSPGELLLGCLHFYGARFDYGATAISVREPHPFLPVRVAVRQGWTAPPWKHNAPKPKFKFGASLGSTVPAARLHIRDPLQDGADVGAPTTRVAALRDLFQGAYQALAAPTGDLRAWLEPQAERHGGGGVKRWRGDGGGAGGGGGGPPRKRRSGGQRPHA